MKTKFATTLLMIGTLLGPVAALAVDSDSDRSHPKAFVKDSAITTEIKSKLAAEHLTSLGRIHVDTDLDGVVWLSGTARTQEAIHGALRDWRGAPLRLSARRRTTATGPFPS